MELHDLKCLGMINPLGIETQPYFSWEITSGEHDVMQKSYRIKVTTSESLIWDTETVISDTSTFVAYQGPALASSTRYDWTVEVTDNTGNTNTASAWFETTLLDENKWKACWVEAPFKAVKRQGKWGKQPPAVMFRKEFVLDRKPKRARLYTTCHGIYRLFVNGQQPDDREFAPEFTVYEKYLCYQTYDITPFLRQGQNVLGFYVGDGWYFGKTTVQGKLKSEHHAILFQMEVQYEDGNSETIISDNDVCCSEDGPVRFSDLFCGEKYDARKEQPEWTTAGYNTANWQRGILKNYPLNNLYAQHGEGVYPVMVLPAQKLFISPKGETIIDFGQVIAGRIRMKINAPAGTEIIFDHTEVLDREGNFFSNILAAVGSDCTQRDMYICCGGEKEEFEPLFTFHGFRYVRIQGLSNANKENFQAVVLSSDKENTSRFMCSNADINRLVENGRWSQRANMLSVPTDCPQREKAGWTGDIQIYAKTALMNENVTTLLVRWLQNLCCDQAEDGSIPVVSPFTNVYRNILLAMNLSSGDLHNITSAGWGDAVILVPFSLYEITGNTVILRELYPAMKKWVDYIIRQSKKRGKGSKLPPEIEDHLWNTGFHFGEWLIPSMSRSGLSDSSALAKALKISTKYAAPVYGYISVSIFARIAKLLGNNDDSEYYSKTADKIKFAINHGVIGPDGNPPLELQGAYVMLLYYDLVDAQYKKQYAERLARMIHDNGDRLDTGFLATPLILDTLCETGYEDLAYKLLYQEECPSWLYEVKHGATTIWESWVGYDQDDNPLKISYNHYAFGCVSDWIYRYINGVNKTEVGFKHIVIKPRPDKSLVWANFSFQSAYGEIVSEWKRENGKFILNVAIPCNTTATVFMPNGNCHEIGSGNYTFSEKE
jgi:alpha-L-rhamnosidase